MGINFLVDQRSWTEDKLDIAFDIRAAIQRQQLGELQRICMANPWVVREGMSPDSESAWLSTATRRNDIGARVRAKTRVKIVHASVRQARRPNHRRHEPQTVRVNFETMTRSYFIEQNAR